MPVCWCSMGIESHLVVDHAALCSGILQTALLSCMVSSWLPYNFQTAENLNYSITCLLQVNKILKKKSIIKRLCFPLFYK